MNAILQGDTAAREPAIHEIIAALSFALDLTEGAVPGHAIRSCLLALRIAEQLKLSAEIIGHLTYAALLKDVGCSSNAARMCQIIGGDDRAVKAGAKLADWTRPHKPDGPTLKLLWKEVLPDGSGWKRVGRILQLGFAQHRNNRELIELRCDRGASIVRKIGLHDEVAIAVRHLDEHWNGGGYPGQLRGEQIPLTARILGVEQHLDAFCMSSGPQRALDVLVERKGRWFDPTLVRAAAALDRSGELWTYCMPDDGAQLAHAAVLERDPGDQSGNPCKNKRAGSLDSICEAFAEVVDAKSPFTFYHSQGVRHATVVIATMLGLSKQRVEMLRRAALLHDLGKLSVSNAILDKPGKLTSSEFTAVKAHSRLSGEILGRVRAFQEIAHVASNHHERLDGSGYPFGLGKHELDMESRLLAVADVYAALSENRPYRGGLETREISAIMDREVPDKLDPVCYDALRASKLFAGEHVPKPVSVLPFQLTSDPPMHAGPAPGRA